MFHLEKITRLESLCGKFRVIFRERDSNIRKVKRLYVGENIYLYNDVYFTLLSSELELVP